MTIIERCLNALDAGTVLKCGLTKRDFADALEEVSATCGGMDKALADERGQKLYAGYNSAPADEVKFEKRKRRATQAEVDIEEKARALRAKDPSLSMERACAKAWEQNPGLYAKHQAAISSGDTLEVDE